MLSLWTFTIAFVLSLIGFFATYNTGNVPIAAVLAYFALPLGIIAGYIWYDFIQYCRDTTESAYGRHVRLRRERVKRERRKRKRYN